MTFSMETVGGIPPKIEEAINLFFRDFVENVYYPKSPNALTYDGANALFYSGEAAMNPTGTWLVSEIVQAVQEFEVGFFPFRSEERRVGKEWRCRWVR